MIITFLPKLFFLILLVSISFFSQAQNNFTPPRDVVKEEWVRAYDGPPGWDDHAKDLAVDHLGNVYVTGFSDGAPGNSDFATIKYSPSGDLVWVKRYNGGSMDLAHALVLDDSANVYVTGSSIGSGTQEDYFTIKYNSNGDVIWTARYNGPGNAVDKTSDIVIDQDRNVYITGESTGAGTWRDFATIKYNPEGVEQWVKRFTGPSNLYDKGSAIIVDYSGNIIVTGQSQISNLSECVTIKYNPDGDEEWVFDTHIGFSNDIAVDLLNNVYITGEYRDSSDNPNFFTTKLSPDGVHIWTSFYNGPGNNFDLSFAMGVDKYSNVYVTGVSRGENGTQDFATIKYDSTGTEKWVNRYLYGYINDLALDHRGNVYITGGTGDAFTDYITIKYDSTGTEMWNIKYSSYGVNTASAICIDNQENVYITGSLEVQGGLPTFNYGTVKYSQEIVPVELTSFTAAVTDHYVNLNWSTAAELNNKGFEIERGIPDTDPSNIEWETIGFISGNGTTTEPKNYSFTDEKFSSGVIYYRLKQIDFNGNFEYLPDAEGIQVIGESTYQFSLEQNYPNPFNPSTRISYSIQEYSKIIIKVFDILGNEIETLVNEEKPAERYEVNWNAADLPSGVYFYRLRAGSFVETKKMMLLK